jgi:hypothetical protein
MHSALEASFLPTFYAKQAESFMGLVKPDPSAVLNCFFMVKRKK